MDRCGPPWWARALDAVHTVRLATMTSFSIREYSGYFHFFPGRNGAPLPEAEGFTWFDWGNPLERVRIQLDPGGVLVLIDGGRRFILGRCPCAMADHGYTPPIDPDPGDTTSITLDRGLASWPTLGTASRKRTTSSASSTVALLSGSVRRSRTDRRHVNGSTCPLVWWA